MNENVVLLIEDNDDDIDLTLHWFKKVNFPYKIDVARDGAEALDYLFGKDAAGKKPAPLLILLDLKLPKFGGLEVLRRLRADAALKHVPVAVVTSSTEERDRIDAETLGANIYIRKPMAATEFNDMAMKVQTLLEALKPAMRF